MLNLLAIAVGGAIGSVIRYGLTIVSIRYGSGTTLAGTFAANMIGCLAIGLISGLIIAHPDWIHPRYRLEFAWDCWAD